MARRRSVRRRAYPADADIWSFRRRWLPEKSRLQADLLAGRLRFALLRRVTFADGSVVDLWSPRDALVLKCLARLLKERLGLSKRCAHLKGQGGVKAAVRAVREGLGENRFVNVRSGCTSATGKLGGNRHLQAEDAVRPCGLSRRRQEGARSLPVPGWKRPGLAAGLIQALAQQGISLSGFSAAVAGTRFIGYVALDSLASSIDVSITLGPLAGPTEKLTLVVAQ